MKTYTKRRQKYNIKKVRGCYDPRTNLLIADEKIVALAEWHPLRQGTDGGDRGPAFREERRVHRVPGEQAAGQ